METRETEKKLKGFEGDFFFTFSKHETFDRAIEIFFNILVCNRIWRTIILTLKPKLVENFWCQAAHTKWISFHKILITKDWNMHETVNLSGTRRHKPGLDTTVVCTEGKANALAS